MSQYDILYFLRNLWLKHKNGYPFATTDEQLKRLVEHFEELLNRPAPERRPDIPPANTDLPINCDIPTKTKIRRAISTLMNGKATEPDEIPTEAIKANIETNDTILYNLFKKIWGERVFLRNGKQALLSSCQRTET